MTLNILPPNKVDGGGSLGDSTHRFAGLRLTDAATISDGTNSATISEIVSGSCGTAQDSYRLGAQLPAYYATASSVTSGLALKLDLSGTATDTYRVASVVPGALGLALLDDGTSSTARATLQLGSAAVASTADFLAADGTAASANGLQSYPVSSAMPGVNDTLTFDGLEWAPNPAPLSVNADTLQGHAAAFFLSGADGSSSYLGINGTADDSDRVGGTTPTAFGLSLIDDGTSSAARTTLQLGNVATINTSGTGTQFLDGTGQWTTPAGGGGSGDMTKAVYDTEDDGTVNSAREIDGTSAADISLALAGKLDTSGTAVDSDRLGGNLASFYAGTSDLLTVAGGALAIQVASSDGSDLDGTSGFTYDKSTGIMRVPTQATIGNSPYGAGYNAYLNATELQLTFGGVVPGFHNIGAKIVDVNNGDMGLVTRGDGGVHVFRWYCGNGGGSAVERMTLDVTNGLVLTSIDATANSFKPATLTNAAAPTGGIYYSSTWGALAHKDPDGTSHVLYPEDGTSADTLALKTYVVGTVNDGEYLKRSGSTIVSAAVSTGALTWQQLNADGTATAGNGYFLKTGGLKLALPASPTNGATIAFRDDDGSAAANPFVIQYNGAPINHDGTNDLVIDTRWYAAQCVYNADGTNWGLGA